MIYVNLPVKDLAKSTEFFAAIGYEFDPKFTDEKNAACMIIDDTIFVMLVQQEFFATFTSKPMADATTTTEVLLGLSAPSREAVDIQVAKAVAAGGSQYKTGDDQGFMYGSGFQDLDGHLWEIFWMDPAALEQMSAASDAPEGAST